VVSSRRGEYGGQPHRLEWVDLRRGGVEVVTARFIHPAYSGTEVGYVEVYFENSLLRNSGIVLYKKNESG